MRVTVLQGGASEEREVSLSSGAQVCAALREAGHDVTAVDPGSAGAGREGAAGDSAEVLRRLGGIEVTGADVVFIALHGGAGEDGTIQGVLDLLGIPYVGSGRLGCALAMDKDVTKRLLRDAGIRTPDWIAGLPEAERVERELGLPVIVKAASGGSSLRLHLAHDRAELDTALVAARGFGDLALFEAWIPGRELTVSIVGERALPVGEIIPEHELFDYTCKYEPGMAQEIFPADIGDDLAQELQAIALDVHRVLRLRDVSRVDFMVDAQGRPWCLEANALPGMTPNSLLPRAARAAGQSLPEVCDELVRRAAARGTD